MFVFITLSKIVIEKVLQQIISYSFYNIFKIFNQKICEMNYQKSLEMSNSNSYNLFLAHLGSDGISIRSDDVEFRLKLLN